MTMKRIFSLLICFFVMIPTTAFGEDTNSPIEFSIEPILTQNQDKNQTAYHHIKAVPNKSYKLSYYITNKTKKNTEIFVTPSNLLTSPQGQYYFVNSDGNKTSRIHKDYRVAHLINHQSSIKLKPLEKKKITFEITLPATELEGLMVGGLIFSPEQTFTSKSDGMTINYKIQKILPIKLEISTIESHVPSLDSITYKDKSILIGIDNTQPTILKEGKGRLTVQDDKGEIAFQKEFGNFEMAPMTGVDFQVPLEGNIKEGEYVGTIDLQVNGEKNTLTQVFEVKANSNINSGIPDVFNLVTDSLWIWIIIGTIIIIFFIIWWKKKRKYTYMQARTEDLYNKKLNNFLIEKVKKNLYYLHREIEEKEVNEYKSKQIVKYKKKFFEKKIGVFSSEGRTKEAVYSYWNKHNQNIS
ncbi:WxL protein peptidoglycan domain-containing protein [Bacillus cihuensis]|uniref:WxL protein peptidoglycan domain-containing protein n=1 Tax=Bacillus cihuensis TaxID=1208599 RepID=UPI0004017BB5|nr:DUF916 domain-containing protein [Bacillus cihuensis]